MNSVTQPKPKDGESPFRIGRCAVSGMQLDSRGRSRDGPVPAFSLKHAANMKKSYSSQKEAVERAIPLVPKGVSPVTCVRETTAWKFTQCINGKVIKPSDSKQRKADSLVQVARATPMGRADDAHPSAFTFANMTVQTDESLSMITPKVPDELKQTHWRPFMAGQFGNVCWNTTRCVFEAREFLGTPSQRGVPWTSAVA